MFHLLNTVKKLIKTYDGTGLHFIKKDKVLEWAFNDVWVKTLTKESELEWGQNVSETSSNQWTTKLSETVFFELMTLFNKNPSKPIEQRCSNGKKIRIDFETDNGLYEIKSRTYTIGGTAGEKILGTPIKYSECKRLFNKPLFIVCMAAQIKEADETFNLFHPKSEELTKILDFYRTEFDIHYIKLNTLIEQLLHETLKISPIIKWVGGKRSIMNEILKHSPADFNNYHEPFLGGGSVFMELYNTGKLYNKKIYLSDSLYPLINLYSVVKHDKNLLIKELENTCYNTKTNTMYNTHKTRFNTLKFNETNNIECAALFLYLNKTCFNGMYRENQSGFYNVPIGKQAQLQFNIDLLTNLSFVFNNLDVFLSHYDYSSTLQNIQKGDFVYIDPPYHGTFVNYTKDSFTEQNQIELKNYFLYLTNIGCKAMISNSNTEFIRQLYSDISGISFVEIPVKRLLNCTPENRKNNYTELLIKNF